MIIFLCLLAAVAAETCLEKQEFMFCGSSCQATCNNFNLTHTTNVICLENCKDGCFCKLGFVAHPDGRCVEAKDCPNPPKCLKPNEIFSACDYDCANCATPNPQKCHENCKQGCFCQKGYLRDDNGNCVEAKKCMNDASSPQQCKQNEIFMECGTACPPTCSKPNPQECTLQCVPGCFCKSGFFRDNKGECVEPLKCPPFNVPSPQQCKSNEIFNECGSACAPTCDNPNPQSCTLQCVPGCFCKSGFLRNKNGECVELLKCSQMNTTECKPNELFKQCGARACEPTCENPEPETCPAICTSGCFCQKGFLRDQNGNCVEPHMCPREKCPKPHETFSACGKSCEKTCKAPQPTACILACTSGCVCQDGYLRDDKGDCIPAKECPSVAVEKCPKPNQEYSECGTYACEPNCQVPQPTLCPAICNSGCFCKKGFLRDRDGSCVEPEKCMKEKCHQPNEEFQTCGTRFCEASCRVPQPTICPFNCEQGCFCKKGFLRSEKGECVEPKNCWINTTAMECNKPHEKFNQCGSLCEPHCNPKPCPKDRIGMCLSGCFCEDGFIRDDEGKCTEAKECKKPPTQQCDKPHQKWNDCGTACEATCKDPSPSNCSKQCVAGCFCEVGFVKNDQGDCVQFKDCSKLPQQCNKPHQIWNDCGTACEATCQDPSPSNCSKQCIAGCFCEVGFVKNDQGDCVQFKECPDDGTAALVKCADPHEKFTTCGSSCQPSCQFPKPDCIFAGIGCVQGCFCEEGYIRSAMGVCIRIDQC